MHTSNKLLLTFALALTCSTVISLLIAKNNAIITESDYMASNKVMEEREIFADFQSTTLLLNGNYRYILDPNSKSVKFKAEQNTFDQYEFSDDGTFTFSLKKDSEISKNRDVVITIGIKDKNDIKVITENRAEMESNDKIVLGNFELEADDHAELNLNLETEYLNIKIENQVNFKLNGLAKYANVENEDYAEMNGNFVVDTLNLIGTDKSDVSIDQAKYITGILDDNASLYLKEKWITSQLVLRDYADADYAK